MGALVSVNEDKFTAMLATMNRTNEAVVALMNITQTARIDATQALQLAEQTAARVNQIESELVTVTSAERKRIGETVRRRVAAVEPDRGLRKPLYAQAYRHIHNVYNIASYQDLPRSKYQHCLELIGLWVPVARCDG